MAGQEILLLYNQCVSSGTHPFKEAEVVLLPKPKRDPATAKGWRPIALLSVLGKGLERVIARRLARLRVEKGWFGRNQAGCVPGRSTIDILLAFTHDIRTGWRDGRCSVMVAMDVQGAFDSVHPDALKRELLLLGVPPQVCSWAWDLCGGRTVPDRTQHYRAPRRVPADSGPW